MRATFTILKEFLVCAGEYTKSCGKAYQKLWGYVKSFLNCQMFHPLDCNTKRLFILSNACLLYQSPLCIVQGILQASKSVWHSHKTTILSTQVVKPHFTALLIGLPQEKFSASTPKNQTCGGSCCNVRASSITAPSLNECVEPQAREGDRGCRLRSTSCRTPGAAPLTTASSRMSRSKRFQRRMRDGSTVDVSLTATPGRL